MVASIKYSKKQVKKEVTIGAGKANLLGLIFIVPAIALLLAPYYYLWPEQFSSESLKAYLKAKEMMTLPDIVLVVLILVSGIVTHELLHGIGWSFYAKNGWKSIKFGVVWKYLTPYCHCSEALLLKSYRIGSVLPAVILGIIPSVISIITGEIWLLLFGFFFTFAAGGDFLILWLLRKEKNAVQVLDHPDKIGCIIFQDH